MLIPVIFAHQDGKASGRVSLPDEVF